MVRAKAIKQARLELARRNFFDYCNLKAPEFYKKDRKYLVDICNSLQDFVNSDDDIFILNMPPRTGKSRTVSMLCEWLLGKDRNYQIMTGSYNEILSTNFSKRVRNSIQEIKADEDIIVYSDIFPDTKIKYGESSMNLWSLEGGYNNYLATSPSGTATGFGARLLILDDLIRSSEEAYNVRVLDQHWDWFNNTMLSRLETGGKIIVIQTRWHTQDLTGRIINEMTGIGYKVKHTIYKAIQDDGSMLNDEVIPKHEYIKKTASMSKEIAMANYQQEPVDVKGKLYSNFKTYSSLVDFKEIKSYTDTADTGSDYLASFIYGVTLQNEAYILDWIYTKDPMEVTEPMLAMKLMEHKVNTAMIESNNGGRGFARAVERILLDKYKSNHTTIDWFHQSQNKQARILSNGTWITEHIYFPDGWHNMDAELYEALTTYQKEGKNRHDDSPDALTGIAESFNKQKVEISIVREKINLGRQRKRL